MGLALKLEVASLVIEMNAEIPKILVSQQAEQCKWLHQFNLIAGWFRYSDQERKSRSHSLVLRYKKFRKLHGTFEKNAPQCHKDFIPICLLDEFVQTFSRIKGNFMPSLRALFSLLRTTVRLHVPMFPSRSSGRMNSPAISQSSKLSTPQFVALFLKAG